MAATAKSGCTSRTLKGKRAERLREIESERGAELAAGFADADEIESAAACPLHMRERGDGDVGGQANSRTAAVQSWSSRPGNDLQRRAVFFRQALPRIVVGRELLVENENALALCDGQIARGGRDAIAGGGNDGDVIGRAVEQLRGGRAKLVRAR